VTFNLEGNLVKQHLNFCFIFSFVSRNSTFLSVPFKNHFLINTL
jgi:hypothetical protein